MVLSVAVGSSAVHTWTCVATIVSVRMEATGTVTPGIFNESNTGSVGIDFVG